MKNWIKVGLYILAQFLIFRLIAIEYAKYSVAQYQQKYGSGAAMDLQKQ